MGYGYNGENLCLGIQEPEAPKAIGHCLYCGEIIADTDTYYNTGSGMVHVECLEDYIMDEYSPEELAQALCFDRVRQN